MTAYIDTSVVLRALLIQPGPRPNLQRWSRLCTSALLGVEARRTLDRMRLLGMLTDAQRAAAAAALETALEALDVAPVTAAVLECAGQPFPTVIGTLDAIHLATAVLLDREEPIGTFLTHDRQLALAAQSAGFAVEGV